MTGVRTLIKIGWRGFLRTDIKYGLERKVTLWRHMLGGQPTPFMDAYFNFSSRKQRGPLTDAQVSELEEYQSATVNADYSSRSKEMNVTVDVDPASPSSRKKFVLVLANILKQGNIKRVANIGARASAYLAPRFPEIEFISVDFQPELEMHNSPFPQQPNWRFKIGYPLHLIQRGELRVDLYFCVSTSVLFNNVELNAYLDAIATHAKAIAFCVRMVAACRGATAKNNKA